MKKILTLAALCYLFFSASSQGYSENADIFTFCRDSAGIFNANGDYSGADSTVFFYAPPVGEVHGISRMIVTIQDAGAPDAGLYGNNISLTEGISVAIMNTNGDTVSLLTPEPILANARWGTYCHDVTNHDFGSGDDVVTIRWTFTKAGRPLIVDGSLGEYFVIFLKDDFSGLNNHYFHLQGSILEKY